MSGNAKGRRKETSSTNRQFTSAEAFRAVYDTKRGKRKESQTVTNKRLRDPDACFPAGCWCGCSFRKVTFSQQVCSREQSRAKDKEVAEGERQKGRQSCGLGGPEPLQPFPSLVHRCSQPLASLYPPFLRANLMNAARSSAQSIDSSCLTTFTYSLICLQDN